MTRTPQKKLIHDLLSCDAGKNTCVTASSRGEKIFLLVFTGLNALLTFGQVLFVMVSVQKIQWILTQTDPWVWLQVELSTLRRICALACMWERESCLFFPCCTALAHLGYTATIGPLLWNGRGSFHSAAPWAGLVCLQHGWTAGEKISLNWKGFYQDCGRDSVIHVLPPSAKQHKGHAPVL